MCGAIPVALDGILPQTRLHGGTPDNATIFLGKCTLAASASASDAGEHSAGTVVLLTNAACLFTFLKAELGKWTLATHFKAGVAG
jgi:hypothetical protein